jgi:hypothetical protein
MIFIQIWHGPLPYVFIFYLLIHIYLLIIHPFTYPPTYTFSPTYVHIYLCFSPLYNLLTYLPTYLHIIYFPIHPFIFLILITKCNHYV